MSKSIHFILPGGGVRGSFQAGFLYELFTKYKDSFSLHRVDGTSVGSINGFAIILDELEVLKDTWLKIKNINDFFENWSNTPLIGSLYNLYYGFYNSGLYNNTLLHKKLSDNLTTSLKEKDKEHLSKFSCTVTNVHKARIEYISGTNSDIIQYVTASSSPWIICNPCIIDDYCYTDGGVLETYPIKNIKDSTADLIIIVGFDQEVVHFAKPDFSNMLYFMATLLDIARYNSINSKEVLEYVHNGKCIPITNPMKVLFTDFTPETIKVGFEHGQDAAEQFYKTYLK